MAAISRGPTLGGSMSNIERDQVAPHQGESFLRHAMTQQQRIEESLKEHRDRLQLALSAARMAVWAQGW